MNCFSNAYTTETSDTFEMRIYSDATKTTLLDYQIVDLHLSATYEPFLQEYNIIRQKDGSSDTVGEITTGQLTL